MSFFSRFLVFLLGLAVLAVVAAWIMGGEAVKNSTRISIKARPSIVFRYLTDGEKVKQWAKDIVSVGSFESEDSLYQERVVRGESEDSIWEDSVLRFQAGETLSIQSRNGGLTKTLVFNLEENELGGTNVDYRLTESASGVEQFMFSFKENNARTIMGDEMARLKSLIESEVDPKEEADIESDESPVVASSNSDDNGDSDEASQASSSPSDSSKISVVDQVLGSEYSKENLPNEKRKFESLFGTGG